jgi:hypothetical protein
MFAAIKKMVQGKKTLDKRGGRFLTVYLGNGNYKNGKVLKAGYLRTKVQLAQGGITLVSNRNIDLVATDHELIRV